jgi:hypothetical protein
MAVRHAALEMGVSIKFTDFLNELHIFVKTFMCDRSYANNCQLFPNKNIHFTVIQMLFMLNMHNVFS